MHQIGHSYNRMAGELYLNASHDLDLFGSKYSALQSLQRLRVKEPIYAIFNAGDISHGITTHLKLRHFLTCGFRSVRLHSKPQRAPVARLLWYFDRTRTI